MWWQDLLIGYWNGVTSWIVFLVHLFGAWGHFPLYDAARSGGWYDLGFLIGASSPLLGAAGSRSRGAVRQEPPRVATAPQGSTP